MALVKSEQAVPCWLPDSANPRLVPYTHTSMKFPVRLFIERHDSRSDTVAPATAEASAAHSERARGVPCTGCSGPSLRLGVANYQVGTGAG